MKRIVGRLVCSWMGHTAIWHPGYGEPDYTCTVCGRELSYEDMARGRGLRLALVERWNRVAVWWMKCDDCGKRFGRHDENVTHLPF